MFAFGAFVEGSPGTQVAQASNAPGCCANHPATEAEITGVCTRPGEIGSSGSGLTLQGQTEPLGTAPAGPPTEPAGVNACSPRRADKHYSLL